MAIIILKSSLVLNNFEFEYPFVFILLLLIFCIYKCPATIKRIIFPHIHFFSKKTYTLHKEKLLYSLIFTLLVMALASPITYDQKESSKRKGRDLVFALDTSGSMAESGFDSLNPQEKKFTLLKELLKSFVLHRYDDNVGVSLFGTFAYGAIPLSYDMQSLTFLLNFFDVGIAGDSTAIGEGLVSALKILKVGKAKEKVIILITDGYQNSGAISVKQAVEKAQKMGVKIYPIGLGKSSAYDKNLLSLIAKNTKAKMFQAQNIEDLANVYKELNRLEPSAIRSQHYLNKHELFIFPLSLALLLLSYILLKQREIQA